MVGWSIFKGQLQREKAVSGQSPPCCTPCRNPELLTIPSAEHIQWHKFPGMARDTDTGQGSWSPEDHLQPIPSRPAYKYCTAEHPERLMLPSSSLGSLGKAQEGHQLLLANKDHSHPAMKGHAWRGSPLWMNIIMASCRTIPCPCRQCAAAWSPGNACKAHHMLISSLSPCAQSLCSGTLPLCSCRAARADCDFTALSQFAFQVFSCKPCKQAGEAKIHICDEVPIIRALISVT